MPRPLAIEILDAIVSSYRSQRMHAHEHEDDAPTEERDFEVGQFTSLELSGPFDVEIRTGESASVHATGPDWALDSLAVEHKGERLFISWDGWRKGQPRGWESCSLTVIYIPAEERRASAN